MTYATVRMTRTGDTATITLARPERRNTLSSDTMGELADALGEVARSDALAVVVAAEGPVFSAGHNLADLAGTDLQTARALFRQCTELMATIQALPQPVVARVHALATAAGCQLVASCDLAVAAASATFAIPGGKGGFFCHTPLVAVARSVGRKRALEFALSGDAIDATTAAEWGLVNQVVPDAQLDAAVADLVARVTRGSASSRALGKHTFYAQVELEQRQAYDLAVEVMAAAATTADAQEGFAAFLDKRRPVFTGRPSAPRVFQPGR